MCVLVFISIFPSKCQIVSATYAVLHASRKSSGIMMSYTSLSFCNNIREADGKLGRVTRVARGVARGLP